jgi:hypothetical protein
MKMISGTLILCLLGAMPLLIHAQGDKSPSSSSEKKASTTKTYKETKARQGPLKSVDLCAMAQEMSLTKEEATRKNQAWMEFEIQDKHTTTTRTKGMPQHSDITLSVEKKERVRFFCTNQHQLRIDRFEKAKAPGCAASINPAAPDSPFPASVTFPTVKSNQILLGPPVATAIPQGCYKFSFTVWMTANPIGTAVDPHLIVKP